MSKLNKLVKNEYTKISRRNENKIRTIIKEEFDALVKEAQKNEETVKTKLETMRKNLIQSGKISIQERGSARNDIGSRPERRVPLETVSRIIDIPVNELVLHFLNGHRSTEGQALIEYRLGCVYFYGEDKDGEVK